LLLVRKGCELTATVLVADYAITGEDSNFLVLASVVLIMLDDFLCSSWSWTTHLRKTTCIKLGKACVLTADLLAKLLGPLTNLLIAIGNALTPGRGFKSGPFASEAEFRDLVDQASESGFVEESEREMIHSVFDLGETLVRELMVPRTEMVWIESGKNLRQGLSLALRSGFTRIPVI
jgi:CBS domain containing-hemolysin-like protein